MGTEMSVPRTYDVTDENEVKAIYIPTQLAGLDTIGSCKDQIYMTLDYELPSGLLKTVWSEKGDNEGQEDWPFWVEEMDGFDHLMIRITHDDVVYKGQMMFKTLASSITSKMRFTYRDGLGNELIFNEFDMTVSDPKVDQEQ